MKYIAKVNGKTYEVEVERADRGYAPIPRSTYTGVAEPAKAAPAPAPAPTPAPAPAPTPAPAPASTPTPAPAQAAAGNTPVNSPMPGSVFKIVTREGQSVTAGETLLILEAMKMEIEVAAPTAGTVKQIVVSEGNTIETDQLLVMLG